MIELIVRKEIKKCASSKYLCLDIVIVEVEGLEMCIGPWALFEDA